MGKARRVTWEADELHGEAGWRYNDIFLSSDREGHIGRHTIMLEERRGVSPHGMWMHDIHYPSIDEMIWAYAARASRMINRNDSRLIGRQIQGNGRHWYRLRLTATDWIGIADAEESRPLQARIRGLWYVYTQYADIVFEPMSTTGNGHQVYAIVTFFPVSPPTLPHVGPTAEFIEAENYEAFQR